MREVNKIAESLFEKIRDRFEDVSLGDENAKATQNPENARFFNFDYMVNEQNYGNITLSLIDETSLKVYFSKNISSKLEGEDRQKWYAFLRELREFAKRNLLSFEPRDITRSTLKHRDVQQVSKADSTYSKDEVIGEGRMYGTSRSSYENDGDVKLIVRHTGQVDPERRGDRSRKIKSIYVETAEGERFKLPHNNLRYARAMARHVSEGGALMDDFGQHITRIAEECSKLRPFKNSMRRRTFEDQETQAMVEAAFEYHGLLNNTLKRMSGRKGYAACKESFHADETLLDDFDVDSLRERFVKRTYNERMEDALPIVHKAYEMKKSNKFAEQFESWADSVVNENTDPDYADLIELLADELPVGVDAINASGALESTQLADNENYQQLADRLAELADQDPSADARDHILGWMSEFMPRDLDQIRADITTDSDEYNEGNTYGASSMDEPNVNEDDMTSTMTIDQDGNKKWRNQQGQVHRTDGPAVEYADGYKAWFLNGELHRKDGPAVEAVSGTKIWFLNGKLHRTDGPAVEMADGTKVWWVNDRRHRTDGPALEYPDGRKVYYLKGRKMTKKEWAKRTQQSAMTAGVNEDSEGTKYGVYRRGGSLGSRGGLIKTFDTKEEAQEYAKRQRRHLTPGERSYYKMGYNVKPVKPGEQVDEGYDAYADEDQIESIQTAIIRRITNNIGQHQELLLKAGPEGVMNAARDVASFHAPVDELGSSDISNMVREVYNEVGVDFPELNEGRVKEVAMDIEELSNKQFYAKYKMSKEDMKAKLAEGQGDDYVNKSEKLKRMGAKELSTMDKLKMMPKQAKAAFTGDSEDDLVNYNKQFNEEIAQLRRIAGLE